MACETRVILIILASRKCYGTVAKMHGMGYVEF